MLKRIWRQLVRWLQNLFGGGRSSSRPVGGESVAEPPPELTNADLEFLFMQLLEGTEQGRGHDWAMQWLQRLENRVPTQRWLEWLRSFGERLLASPVANNELASRLVRLGELGLGEVGDASYELGMRLLTRDAGEPIWEYAGPDAEPTAPTNQEEMAGEAITLDELLQRLQEDENLRALVAQQVGLETDDPQEIVEALVAQLNEVETTEGDVGESWEANDDVEALISQSVQEFQAGNHEAAINHINRACELAPDNQNLWFARGELMTILQHAEDAIASYEQAITIQPDFYEAWYNKALVLDNAGRYPEAIAVYDRAIILKPDAHQAWYNRGWVLDVMGQYEEAIASYDKSLEIKPDKDEAWNNRGLALMHLGRCEEAVASYDKALEANPNKDEAWKNRGLAFLALGRWQEAVESFDKALAIKSDEYDTWSCRGVAQANLKQYSEAVDSFDKALAIKPDDYLTWFNRGKALTSMDKVKAAIECFDKVIGYNPNFKEAWEKRAAAMAKLE